MTGVFLAITIVLIIVALVVRDQTEFKLSRLRAELLGLRSDEQRLSEERTDLERMVAQAGDALMRADQRQRAAEKSHREVADMLQEMGVDYDPTARTANGAAKAPSSH